MGTGDPPSDNIPATGEWPEPTRLALTEWPTVPGYEVLAEVGRGGMGVVYKARRTDSGRLVALKMILDAALAGPQVRARFRIEAEAASRLRHPNVVPICEVGEHAGRPYLAMEFVEGGSLDRHLAGRPLPAAQSAELARTLALAVAHAHEQKIVHRDLKPANILLASGRPEPAGDSTPGGSSPPLVGFEPMITDFGLAKRLDAESTAWTRDGAVLGTPSYMAPEQAAGRVQEVGPATDVYALGATLYELLTGRPPFAADSWAGTVQQVLHDEPARPGPGVPPDLETICLKCLEKEPGQRYATAAELADDLDRFLGGRPIIAVAPGPQERLTRHTRRDGYRIVAEVGRGPRSTVYQARTEPHQQPVAVKVFPAGVWTREEWESRLRHGADLWAAVAHPQVVTVHRAGWWDGAPYLVTEYVPQGSLADQAHGRPYPVPQALRLTGQLVEIVAYLHRQGVVHGNLKPTNVLMAADGIPRLTDLHLTSGLYRRGPGRDTDAGPAGLGYLPPEAVREPGADPRFHTDLYGLGLILYELLAARPAFDGANAEEVLEQVRSHEPLPPSRFNADIPPELDWICLRCLNKNPWRRFLRVYDLSTRLRRLQDNPGGRGA